jgi:aryl-alcohol dehydrogenase-like predicted oxidoreductase
MSKKNDPTGVSRRDFVKTVGLAGMAVAGAGVPGALAAPAPPAGAAPAGATPRRKLGKTGVDVSILNLGGMFDTINNQLLLKQALKWGVTMWDTAESYGRGLSEEGYGRFFARNPGARKEIFLVTKLEAQGAHLTERLDQNLKRLQTDHVDLFFIHNVGGIDEMGPAIKEWGDEMKKAGKFKFFGFSTHSNMADCLAGAAKLDWIDAVMFSYNFRILNDPKLKEAMNACEKAGVGMIAMKSMAGGPGAPKIASRAKLKMADQFLKRGFTDKQAKLKVIWENPQISSLCSQMPNLTILAANVAAARDQTKLAREEFDSLRQYALETQADYCAGCGSLCQAAVGGAVPVNEVMRCLMYHNYYGEPELARLTFAGLPEAVRQGLTAVDYSRAEAACPQRLAIAQLMRQAQEILA